MLFPEMGDDFASYEHHLIEVDGQALAVLKRNRQGHCVYLDEATGCTIHERAPAVCGMSRNAG
jgi:hypothetical protein